MNPKPSNFPFFPLIFEVSEVAQQYSSYSFINCSSSLFWPVNGFNVRVDIDCCYPLLRVSCSVYLPENDHNY